MGDREDRRALHVLHWIIELRNEMRDAAGGAAIAQGEHCPVDIVLALRGFEDVEEVVLRPLEILATEVVANELARLIVERERHDSSGRLTDRRSAAGRREGIRPPSWP